MLYTDVLPFRLQVLFWFPQGICYSFKRKMRTENKAFFKFLYGRRAPQTKVVYNLFQFGKYMCVKHPNSPKTFQNALKAGFFPTTHG